jgi:hypothetical protein
MGWYLSGFELDRSRKEYSEFILKLVVNFDRVFKKGKWFYNTFGAIKIEFKF